MFVATLDVHSVTEDIGLLSVTAAAQPRLKSWGGPRFRSKAPRARPKAGLGVGCGGGRPPAV